MKDTQRWQDWLNLVLGAWLILAPLAGVGSLTDIAAWNAYIGGGLVVIFSVWALARSKEQWEEWVNLILGVWLIFAPFALGFSNQAVPMWNQVIVGLVIGIDAAWAIVERRRPAPMQHQH
ncbi:MAG TPA: SPW repeat protein [Casimicrobiaceae bacterium]